MKKIMWKLVVFIGFAGTMHAAAPARATPPISSPPPAWQDVMDARASRMALLLLRPNVTNDDARRVTNKVRELGGDSVIWSDREAALVELPPGAAAVLARDEKIELVATHPVEKSLAGSRRHADLAIKFFNALKDGSLRAELERTEHLPAPELAGDAVSVPAFSGHKAKTAPMGFPIKAQDWNGVNGYIGGEIDIDLFFVESSNTGSENYYTWTQTDIQQTAYYVFTGFMFWSDLARNYGHKEINYTMWWHDPLSDTRVIQPYEPVLHSVYENYLWVNPIMANYGYTDSTGDPHNDRFARTEHYNSDMRASRNVASNFCIFLGYNPPSQGAPGKYAGTENPITYIGGPYVVFLAYPFGSSEFLPTGIAHEMGHIFWACDEYSDEQFACSCDICDPSTRPSTNGTTNSNCESCGQSQACIMRYRDNTPFTNRLICSITAQQVGWPAQPCIHAASDIASTDWTAEYFADSSTGAWGRWDPNHLRIRRSEGDGFLNFDWGDGSPSSVGCPVNMDNFSATFKRQVYFSAGNHTLTVTSDDGFSVYVDNNLVMSALVDQPPTTYSQVVNLSGGYHSVTVYYYENMGGATFHFTWN